MYSPLHEDNSAGGCSDTAGDFFQSLKTLDPLGWCLEAPTLSLLEDDLALWVNSLATISSEREMYVFWVSVFFDSKTMAPNEGYGNLSRVVLFTAGISFSLWELFCSIALSNFPTEPFPAVMFLWSDIALERFSCSPLSTWISVGMNSHYKVALFPVSFTKKMKEERKNGGIRATSDYLGLGSALCVRTHFSVQTASNNKFNMQLNSLKTDESWDGRSSRSLLHSPSSSK